MQSKILRGARRLLVTAGVITLVCSVVAPAAVSASNPGNAPQEHPGQAPGLAVGRPADPGPGLGDAQGAGGGAQSVGAPGAAKVWVCHRTAAEEVNPWELAEVSEHAVQTHEDHHDDWHLAETDVAALEAALGIVELHQAVLQHLDPAQLAVLATSCAAKAVVVDEEIVAGGGGNDGPGDGDDTGGNEDGNDGGDEGTNAGGNEDGNDSGDDGGDDGDGGSDGSTGNSDGGNGQQPPAPRAPKPIQVRDDGATPPAAPPAPLPEPQISADEVVAPPAQTPVVNTPAPAGQPEVLGVSTTRTPTRELASGAGVTSLPRTGTDSTTFLALVGGLLVAGGVGLEALGRRGHLAAVADRR